MKICMLTSVHPPFDIRIFYKECKTLSEHGYEVVLIAPHNSDEIKERIHIRAVPKSDNRLKRMTYTVWKVYRAALFEKAEVYHFHDPELLPIGWMLSLSGKKVIYDMHENIPKSILTKTWLKPPFRILIAGFFRLVEKFFMQRMIVIFAEKSYQKDYPWVKNCLEVLNMPMVDELLKFNQPKFADFTLGYIGGVEKFRGSIITLEVLRLLKEAGVQVNWECIGPVTEEHKQEMVTFIEENQLSGVKLHGYMKPVDGWSIMARCHIGVALLMPIPNYVESYPTKMFEYMALGLPVIASDFPLYREIVEENQCGICVNPNDFNNIATAIKELIFDPVKMERMGENGRKAVREKYNWKIEADKLLELYSRI